MKIQTFANHRIDYEHPKGVSATIPDSTMSISTILKRYAQGLPINGARVPLYEDDPEEDTMPDMRTMDLTDIQEMRENATNSIKQLQNELQRADKAKKQKLKEQQNKKVDEPPKTEEVKK